MMFGELRIRASLGDPVQLAELTCYVGLAVDLFLKGIASIPTNSKPDIARIALDVTRAGRSVRLLKKGS